MQICTHRHVPILKDEDGFWASMGIQSIGYCDTIDEVKAEIDATLAEDSAFYGDRDTPLDTPSLDTSFHDHEMDVS